ncbi:MAG TPA: nucleoside triphosphate pyrophosphohydrolase family protein [Bacteroidia bacterium]|nr:nucleoside triphosphate pyrophosphohydrolase family protein [Bacteroidia bacterium]
MSKLKHKIDSVQEFHEVFRIPLSENPTVQLKYDLIELRHRLMQEENDEYLEACRKGDIHLVADALGDQLYILFGTIITHGLQHKIEEVFDEIHRSNMSKLDDNRQPIYREDGKVMKSGNYFLPDIKSILEK